MLSSKVYVFRKELGNREAYRGFAETGAARSDLNAGYFGTGYSEHFGLR